MVRFVSTAASLGWSLSMGLNLCIGYTGLVSFGHSAWFGIGAYAAGLIQLRYFPGEIWLPLLGSMIVVAMASTVIGMQ